MELSRIGGWGFALGCASGLAGGAGGDMSSLNSQPAVPAQDSRVVRQPGAEVVGPPEADAQPIDTSSFAPGDALARRPPRLPVERG